MNFDEFKEWLKYFLYGLTFLLGLAILVVTKIIIVVLLVLLITLVGYMFKCFYEDMKGDSK